MVPFESDPCYAFQIYHFVNFQYNTFWYRNEICMMIILEFTCRMSTVSGYLSANQSEN